MLFKLFFEFFKTGLFAVGGGLATLPFLSAMGDATGWFTQSDLANMLAVSESTPGPIGVNMSSYVGYTVHGWLGAAVATAGLTLPSLLIILIIAAFLNNYRNNRYVNAAFYGLRPASTALIGSAWLSVLIIALLNLDAYNESGAFSLLFRWKAILLAGLLLFLTRVPEKTKELHPIVFILFSALIGIVFQF